MVTTHAPASAHRRRPTASRRFGYLVAIGINAAMLWIVQQLLGWGWPGFLTGAFDELLPLLTASFIASMAVNAVFLLVDRGRVRAFGDLVTAAFGLAVSARAWTVFPFDFTGYSTDWSWVLRTGLVMAIVGTAIAVVVQLTRLVAGDAGPTS